MKISVMTGFLAVLSGFFLISCGSGDVEADGPAESETGAMDAAKWSDFATGECAEFWIIGDIRPAPGETAKAVRVADGRYVEISATPPATSSEDCVVRLPVEAVAFAGFTDGHAHLLGIGLRELTLNLEGTGSIAELKSRVKAAAKGMRRKDTLFGRGWIETGWPEARMPSRQDLDAVVSDRPVILRRADGHAAVVNTAGLKAAGITADTADPEGGRIVRDTDGVATGILVDNAQGLVQDLLPALTDERRRDALELGVEKYAALGWTGMHNMSVDPEDDAILREMAVAGALPLRVMNYLVPDALDELANSGAGCTDDVLVCTMGIKFYVDGALGSRGALLFAPYTDDPSTMGLLLMKPSQARAAYQKALGAGLQVATHAIGDKGNRTVLDWYRQMLFEKGITDHRWRIEHAQILRPADIDRFAKEGVIASMQPSHAIGDLYFAPDRLGSDRLRGAYAWNSLVEAGAMVVGGSDAPVEKGDPRIELYAATQRTGLDGYTDENWHPEEAVPPGDALALFTTNAAYAVRQEAQLGRIAEGYLADMTVFSADPFEASWEDVRVEMTMVGGKIHRR